MKKLLKGGTVLTGSGKFLMDVLLDGEKISAVGQNLPEGNCTVFDVTGKLLCPGFIDAHTHFDLDVCNTTTADDFSSGTRSAVIGGTTTIIDFACPNKGESLSYGLELWHKKADGKSSCDYGFHMTIDDWNEAIIKEIPKMFASGISSFKMYMTYPAMMIGDKDMFQALREIGKFGGIAGVHCENSGVIDALIEDAKNRGEVSPASHPCVRPSAAEAEAAGRLMKMGEVANVPVVIVHLSAEKTLEEVRKARKNGQKVYVESCPQYLLLDDSAYMQPDYLSAAKFVCAPPLRKKSDNEALWKALNDGEIQTISTDHCSFTEKQKMAGKGDFTKIPGGLPGVETRGILLYSEGVSKGRISTEVFCKVLAENPAKLYGMYPQKGVIAPGSDGDIVILDPNAEMVLHGAELHSAAGYTPFEDLRVSGKITDVFLRGEQVVENGNLIRENQGKYISRGVSSL